MRRCCKNCHWLHSHLSYAPSYPLSNLEFWMSDHVNTWTQEQRERATQDPQNDIAKRVSSCFMKEWRGKVFSGSEDDRKFLKKRRKGCGFMKYDKDQSKMVDAYFQFTEKQKRKESSTNIFLHCIGIILSLGGVFLATLSYLFK